MNIIISNANNKPIYEQIYVQIKELIISGVLLQGEALPSIRVLAKDLRISVITTKRAYDELEKDGYINTVPAKGCFVAQANTKLLKEESLKKIESYMQEIYTLSKQCNLTNEEIIE
ncbi:MAG: GntR family transcriptional regulator, partial [Oscillospiraceae bacterium]